MRPILTKLSPEEKISSVAIYICCEQNLIEQNFSNVENV